MLVRHKFVSKFIHIKTKMHIFQYGTLCHVIIFGLEISTCGRRVRYGEIINGNSPIKV